MNKISKYKIVAVSLISIIVCAFLVVAFLAVRRDERIVLEKNAQFEQDFYSMLENEDIEILYERRYTDEYIFDFCGGDRIVTEVQSDVYEKTYHHVMYLYDHKINYKYSIELSHAPQKLLRLKEDTISYNREQAETYYAIFSLYEDMYEAHHGQAALISSYDPDQMEDMILLVYLPDLEWMRTANTHVRECILGRNVAQRTHYGVVLNMPQVIFCSNEETYLYMKDNIELTREYICGKCYQNSDSDNEDYSEYFISLNDICLMLLDERASEFVPVDSCDFSDFASFMEYLDSITTGGFIWLDGYNAGVDYDYMIYENDILE